MRLARIALIVGGIVALPVYGMATLFVLYASVGGDCFPGLGEPCPTKHDLSIVAMRILIVAATGLLVLVVAGWKLDRRLAARERSKHP